jgi:fengycin family lipopeptide synthetase B
MQTELLYWLEHIPDQVSPLAVDDPHGTNTQASEQCISFALTVEETRFLLQEVPQVFQTQTNDVLIAALAQAFAGWSREHYLLIDLEGHGREEILEQVDLSRTVSWFTSLFPVALDLHRLDTCEAALKYVKEQLRAMPHQGIGYGLLRYINEETSPSLAAKPLAAVRFNYLGQVEQVDPGASFFSLVEAEIGVTRSPAGLRSHLFDIIGRVFDGRLRFDWLYSEAMHAQATVEHLVNGYEQALRAMLTYCRTPGVGGYTPSDFPRIELGQDDLDDLLSQLSDILE